jgi:hypothetical protein
MANDVSPGGSVPAGTKAFYSISELIARWGVSRRTIERFRSAGLLEVVKIGRKVLVEVGEVLRFEAVHRSRNLG